jgi:hypothetical protein
VIGWAGLWNRLYKIVNKRGIVEVHFYCSLLLVPNLYLFLVLLLKNNFLKFLPGHQE